MKVEAGWKMCSLVRTKKGRLDFRRLPSPVFDHFPEQRLVIEPKKKGKK